METGDYIEIDGRPAVRLQRIYPHPIDRVWDAVTDSEDLKHWFPGRADIDLTVGGRVVFSSDPNTDDTFGEVLTLDPPNSISFSWGANELRFALEAIGATETRLVLIDVLDGKPSAARNGAGWTVCLGELTKRLDGIVSAGPNSADALPWADAYEAHVAAGVPAGATIPGH